VEVFKSEESILLDHDYDGIRELDHVLPKWWLWLLYATIVFAAWYSGYYLMGFGPTPQHELEVDLKKFEALHPPPPAPVDNAAALVAAVGDTRKISAGREVFKSKCVSCHGDLAQGVIGPNLTDDHWLHGDTLLDIHKTVSEGVPAKGMPSWRMQLSPVQVRELAAFVGTLHGKNLPGKAPEGTVAAAP
jgi:cytochrome c oxidase cbb3-type subunit 3